MAGVQVDTPVAPRRSRGRGRLRTFLRVVGVLCILAGLGVGGYLGWQQWGTSLTTKRWQTDLRAGFAGRVEERQVAPSEDVVKLRGDAVAIVRIPRIDVDAIVVEGTDTESLKKGPGHYQDTAYPWEPRGTVAIAGHRTTYGAPFYSLDALRPGDTVELATEFGTFTYEVTRLAITPPNGILPSGRWVLDETKKPTLVLTTCNPRFSAAQRLIVFADRVD